MRAAGCALAATRAVAEGRVQNAFALIRPPGHHAEPDRIMGFCLLNNVALAVRHAQDSLGLERIAVVDFDVHHGNGTQEAFYEDPNVLYISTHQYPYYPGTGAATELGRGHGLGTTLNIPLSPGHNDQQYEAVYGALVPRMLEAFEPELILVSAGFDVMDVDPLGAMRVTAKGIAAIVGHLVEAAGRLCEGRLVLLLEGGYDMAGLQSGVLASLNALCASASELPNPLTLDETRLGDASRHLGIYRNYFTF